MIDDLVVYRLATERRTSSSPTPPTLAVVRDDAARAASRGPRRAASTDRSLATALVAVQGPRALSRSSTALPADADAGRGRHPATLRYYACVPMRGRGPADALVARTGYTGEDGFELFVAAADAPALWRALLAAGAAARASSPPGLSARDSLRLEAGMPLYGNELDRTTTPHDAGLGRVVRLDKVDADGRAACRSSAATRSPRGAHSAPARVARRAAGPGPPRRPPRLRRARVHAAGRPVVGTSPRAPRRRRSATRSPWRT